MIIDVSYHDGTIDWVKAKPNIEAAIIRCGYGQDLKKQDDKQYTRNVSECKRLGIPFGVYFYSYADSIDRVDGEVAHLKRLLSGVSPELPIFLDLEENKTIPIAKEVANKWLKAMSGYNVGIYANSWWWDNYLKGVKCQKWVAEWDNTQPKIDGMVLWQYDAYGTVAGVGTKSVDLNKNISLTIGGNTKPKKSIEEIAQEVIDGKWDNYPKRKKLLEEAGYNYDEVQALVNKILGVPKYLTVDGVKWALNMRISPSTQAGIICTIPKGKRVILLDKTSKTWYHVKYEGKTGYCWSEYLK